MAMRARYLDSRDVETLTEALSKAASQSREMDLATAFLTKAGAEQVEALLRRLSGPQKKQQVRVLVGTWLVVTEPAALRKLRRNPRIQLRIAKTPGFHVKHLAFRGQAIVRAFTGSANFTAKGLGGLGELIAEVSDKPRAPFASTERDAFRRLWDDGYPDEQTDEVIAKYSKGWKPKSFVGGSNATGVKLLRRFGRLAKKKSAPVDDGTVFWFPVSGTLSSATVAALEKEAPGANGEFVGLDFKSTFERIIKGTRQMWVLDLRGKPKDRSLLFYHVIRPVEMPTDDDGRYFAILTKSLRRIHLTRKNKLALRELGLVNRVDSLSSDKRVLRSGRNTMAAKLIALSKPRRGKVNGK